MNGQLVAKVKDQDSNIGSNEILFDANGFVPGICTYVLTTGSHIHTGKMIINR